MSDRTLFSSKSGGIAMSLVLIVVFGLAAFGSILLSDHLLWDGWSYQRWLANQGQTEYLQRLFREVGRPLDFLFIVPFISVGGVTFVGKLAGVTTWIFIGFLTFLVLIKSRLATTQVAVACCIVSVTLPIFDVLGDVSVWMNTASVLLFWAGWLLVLCLPERGAVRWGGRFLALAVFWLALNLNSLLVFYYACAVCVVVLPNIRQGWRSVWDAGRSTVVRLPDFVLLPVAFWVWKRVFTPNSGYYLDYNNPTLSPGVLGRVGNSLITGFFGGELAGLFESASWVVVSALVVIMVALALDRSQFVWPAIGDAWQFIGLLSGGIFLLLAAAFPYAVVDQSFSSFGWLTRNCILFPLPLGMITVGGLGLLSSVLAPHRPGLLWLVIGFVVLLGIGSSNRTTLRWQGFGAKQESVITKLQDAVGEKSPALLQLRDYFLLPGTIYYYPPIIWTHMLARGRETPRTFVIETAQMVPDQITTDAAGQPQRMVSVLEIDSAGMKSALEQTTMPYAMPEIPLTGAQKIAIVMPGSEGDDAQRIGWEYLKKRWFSPADLPAFLSALTAVQVQDLPDVR